MKVNLRLRDANQRHVKIDVFLNGALCGSLLMTNDEASGLHQIIAHGCAKGVDEFVSSGRLFDNALKEGS